MFLMNYRQLIYTSVYHNKCNTKTLICLVVNSLFFQTRNKTEIESLGYVKQTIK